MHRRMLNFFVPAAICVIIVFMSFRLTNSILAAIIVACSGILCFLLADWLLYYFSFNHFSLEKVLNENETIIISDIPITLVVPLRDIDILLLSIVVAFAISVLSLTPIGKIIILLDRRLSLDVVNHRMLTVPGALWLTNNRILFLPIFSCHQFKTTTIFLSNIVNCEFVSDLDNSNPCLQIETSARKFLFLVSEKETEKKKENQRENQRYPERFPTCEDLP